MNYVIYETRLKPLINVDAGMIMTCLNEYLQQSPERCELAVYTVSARTSELCLYYLHCKCTHLHMWCTYGTHAHYLPPICKSDYSSALFNLLKFRQATKMRSAMSFCTVLKQPVYHE